MFKLQPTSSVARFLSKFEIINKCSYKEWAGLTQIHQIWEIPQHNTCFFNLHLMTERQHHWTFFQQLHNNHLLTFFSSSARCSGSDFMIWSNSANWKHIERRATLYNLHQKDFCYIHPNYGYILPFLGGRTLSLIQTWSHYH